MDLSRGIRLYEESLIHVRTRNVIRWNNGRKLTQAQQMENDRLARALIRHAVLYILGWTPERAYRELNDETAEKLLFFRIAAMISRPRGISPRDYKWLIVYAFPDLTSQDMRQEAVRIYEEVLSGKRRTFPPYLLKGPGPRTAFCLSVILLHYISLEYDPHNTETLYSIFASPKAKDYLRKGKLLGICNRFFPTPLDYLHLALPLQDKDDFLYYFCSFSAIFNEACP